jgi:hypothetical protein
MPNPSKRENAAEFLHPYDPVSPPDRCDRTIVMKKVDDPLILTPSRELFIPCAPDLVDEGNMVGISVRPDSSINFKPAALGISMTACFMSVPSDVHPSSAKRHDHRGSSGRDNTKGGTISGQAPIKSCPSWLTG